MAVFVGKDSSRVLTTLRGTAGYLAPEWLSGVACTPKFTFTALVWHCWKSCHEEGTRWKYTLVTIAMFSYFPVQSYHQASCGKCAEFAGPTVTR